MGLQGSNQLFQRAGGMADGVESGHDLSVVVRIHPASYHCVGQQALSPKVQICAENADQHQR